MLTRKVVIENVNSFVNELRVKGYNPSKVILFGSYAHGRPHSLSDIDLAVWDQRFSGLTALDIEPLTSVISKFPGLQLRTFSPNDSKETDPFIEVIENTGILLS